MSKQASQPQIDADKSQQQEGIDMAAVCTTLARILVWLEENGYSEEQQDDVRKHDALPDPASDSSTQEA